jgi:hypothetical protein
VVFPQRPKSRYFFGTYRREPCRRQGLQSFGKCEVEQFNHSQSQYPFNEDRQQQNRRKRVQVYLPRSMEKPANTLPMCCRPYLGQNSIEDKACLHLSKSRWKNLNSLYLCKRAVDKDCNKIKEAGCKSLTQAPWKNLRNLDLGSCSWS